MKAVPVATFNALEPAQQLERRLQEAGMPATIHDESKRERFWFMSEPLAAIHVEVDQARYLEARRLIQEWDESSGVLREAVRCPECHSSRVEFPQITRKFLMPTLSALLMALRLIPREFYCQDCQCTWPKEKRIEPKRDILGWPYRSRLWHPERVHKAKR